MKLDFFSLLHHVASAGRFCSNGSASKVLQMISWLKNLQIVGYSLYAVQYIEFIYINHSLILCPLHYSETEEYPSQKGMPS